MQKVLSINGEYDKFRVICGTQNRLLIQGKYFNVIGERMKRILAYMK
jgi:hypothetical protein